MSWGLDRQGEPAYGLIFGAFMAAGVLGGLVTPMVRKRVSNIMSRFAAETASPPMALECLAAVCYFVSFLLLLVPSLLDRSTAVPLATEGFALCLAAFLFLELLIGMILPCEGALRSIYFPAYARASVMNLPRILVNGAVALGVVSTNYVALETACTVVASLMMISAILQVSLLWTGDDEWLRPFRWWIRWSRPGDKKKEPSAVGCWRATQDSIHISIKKEQ